VAIRQRVQQEERIRWPRRRRGADAAVVALSGVIAGEAVTRAVEAAELLDFDVDELARFELLEDCARRDAGCG
jgi:hypothetical protein